MTKLRSGASSWCAIMVAILAAVQFTTDRRMPMALFLLFIAIWAFGAIMLHAKPVFGAIGTAAYGLVLGADILAMHGFGWRELIVAAGSFVGAALAIATLVQARRMRAA